MTMRAVRSIVAGAALVSALALHLAGCTGSAGSIALGPTRGPLPAVPLIPILTFVADAWRNSWATPRSTASTATSPAPSSSNSRTITSIVRLRRENVT